MNKTINSDPKKPELSDIDEAVTRRTWLKANEEKYFFHTWDGERGIGDRTGSILA